MSHTYRFIQWNPYKKRYDTVLALSIVTFIGTFFLIGKLAWRGPNALSDEILIIRATAVCAFVMLNFILCIGPLARIDKRFLPLLYNRRHLGVTTFLVGLVHAILVLGFYHGFGRISPIMSLLTSSTQYRSISAFPFEILGLLALVILFLMAVTSHDFWLHTLSPRIWKSLHMLVYVAWGLLVMHVALGALQAERSPIYSIGLAAIVIVVPMLHILAGSREVKHDKAIATANDNWIDACAVSEIPDNRAKVVACSSAKERIAIFRFDGKLSAVSNVCAHQSGPLGEGRIINGCITCPWHGYQYQPHNGCAPPPFTEKLPTYPLRIQNGRVMVNLEPQPPGTALELPTIPPEGTHHER